MTNRRNFIKQSTTALAALAATPFVASADTLDDSITLSSPIDVLNCIREQIESERYGGGHSVEWHIKNAESWPLYFDKFKMVNMLNDASKLRNLKYSITYYEDKDLINPITIGVFPQINMSEINYFENNDKLIDETYQKVFSAFLKTENELFEKCSQTFLDDHRLVFRYDFQALPVLSKYDSRIGWICYEHLGWLKKEKPADTFDEVKKQVMQAVNDPNFRLVSLHDLSNQYYD